MAASAAPSLEVKATEAKAESKVKADEIIADPDSSFESARGGESSEMFANSAANTDDALGEEDFQALYKILGVLAAAGIITSIIAVWYERWDARLAASIIADVRNRLFEHVQNLPSSYFARTKRGEILSRFSIDLAAFEGSVKTFANSAALRT